MIRPNWYSSDFRLKSKFQQDLREINTKTTLNLNIP